MPDNLEKSWHRCLTAILSGRTSVFSLAYPAVTLFFFFALTPFTANTPSA